MAGPKPMDHYKKQKIAIKYEGTGSRESEVIRGKRLQGTFIKPTAIVRMTLRFVYKAVQIFFSSGRSN